MNFDSLPNQRLLLYILIFLSLFPAGAAIWSILDVKKTRELASNIERLSEEAFFKEKREALNKAVIAENKNADKFFIDKELETLVFLKEEIDALTKLLAEPNLADNDTYSSRLDFLKSKNSLAFSESHVQNYPGFTETLETLIKPVELSSEDVQNLLGVIEGTSDLKKLNLGKPQLIITDFKLEKRQLASGSELFQLNLKLLKREFAP